MGLLSRRLGRILALVITGALLLAVPVSAAKPAGAGGGGKGGTKEAKEKHGKDKGHASGSAHGQGGGKGTTFVYFGDRHRVVIRDYYLEQYRAGHCPPGLAKKNNGCLPPGHAKRWVVGQPLPADIVVYELPPQVLVQLGPPPVGYHFVRVDSDILLLAVGTGMVVDALQNLTGN